MRRLFLLLAACAAGCSGSSREPAVVHGRVTLDGQPLEAGSVRLDPVSGKGTNAVVPVADGQFTAWVSPGPVYVRITAMKATAAPPPNAEPADPSLPEPLRAKAAPAQFTDLIPERYNAKTELTIDVPTGTSTHTFDLKSK